MLLFPKVDSGNVFTAYLFTKVDKLSIYDGMGTVKVVLASGFVGEAGEAQLPPIPSGHLTG